MAQSPFSSWTPGTPLANFREIVFGGYIFPLTFQETDRAQKLIIDKRKISHTYGTYTAKPKSSLIGRDIAIAGVAGSGMMGTSGAILVTADDLENERVALARLQGLGTQQLYVRPDRYILAELESFDHKFLQDGGAFRYAEWQLKFYAANPRYYSPTITAVPLNAYNPITVAGTYTANVTHLGNTRAYPIFTIIGACVNPTIAIYQGVYVIAVTFTLTMNAGDRLVLATDPRPETRNTCATYTPNGGGSVNALQYVNVATGFSNNIDAGEFLPYIEDTTQILGGYTYNTFSLTTTAGTTNYQAELVYQDTWI